LSNPFAEAFDAIEQTIRNQQTFETFLVKNLLHQLPEYIKQLPEQKELLDKLAQAGIDKAKVLNDASVAAVKPVKHTIKVEKVD
jgi:hypothetical protein